MGLAYPGPLRDTHTSARSTDKDSKRTGLAGLTGTLPCLVLVVDWCGFGGPPVAPVFPRRERSAAFQRESPE